MSCDECPDGLDRRSFLRAALVVGAGTVLGVSWLDGESGWAGGGASDLRPAAVRGLIRTYAVPNADGVAIDTDGEVILVRHAGAAYAFALACPHRRTALRYDAGKARFQCPKHKSRYQVNGTYISGRATRSMDRYALTRNGDTLVVDTAVVHKSDADPAGWTAAVASL